MAVIHVYAIDTDTGADVRGSRLRTGSAPAAIEHAQRLNSQYSAPRHSTRILYSGDFVDPAFAELTQLAQEQGLDFEVGGN
jgi:hypothetical protein